MLVTMTHPDRPGDEVVVEQVSYRYAYFPLGWVSADDPDWEGAGVTPPIPHASDSSLHGGGVLLDEATITADVGSLAVNTLNIVAITGLVITVPEIERPVELSAQATMRHSAANASCALVVAPVGATVGQQVGTAYGFVAAIGKLTSPRVSATLPPGSGGDYQAFVGADVAGNITVVAAAFQPGRIKAVTL